MQGIHLNISHIFTYLILYYPYFIHETTAKTDEVKVLLVPKVGNTEDSLVEVYRCNNLRMKTSLSQLSYDMS